ELQDLIVALRAYAPQAEGIRVISCSIDPTQEGLRQMQEFWQSLPGSAALRDSRAIAQGMRDSLGLHTVTIRGVSPKTHFAQVLVEADYRMKLIGIGLEQPPVNIPSYVSKASPRSATANGMQRWYFTPNYETVRVSDDRHAMELVGEGVKLINENELVQGDGSRVESSLVDRASQLFVKAFTEKYPELARRSPVFGQLRNLIDLSIAAAYIHEQDWFGKAGWKMSVFADEKAYPVESYTAPTQVETAVNVIWKGNRLMTPIGGGVNIQPTKALSTDNVMADDNGQLGQLQNGIDIKALQDGQWWWD
ncbi:MAG: DUF1598 domain-containing protein, partial [Planctomycetales bacterium]|nr:DUF1598 domain-containing protein [Planctomycetales bacterium]